MPTGTRTPIPAPPAAAPRFGLLASIPVTKDAGRWENGVSYSAEGCNTGILIDPCADPATLNPVNFPDAVEWDPYALSVSEACSAFSGTEENAGRVRRLLNMATETLLGAELWDGAMAQSAGFPNTWLADSSDPNFVDLSPTGGPAGLTHGLACLEEYLASNNGGQQGVIHATAQVVTHWESFRLLRLEGNKIMTFKDTLVIPSPGYSGNDPSGDIGDNNVWAYATDMPRIFLGDIQEFPIEQSLDYRNNTIQMVAQRLALVEWQRCRHAGIQLCVTLCGSAGS